MTDQFIIAIAVAPVLSLVIVVAGYIVQNSNLNARTSEIRSDIEHRFTDFRDIVRAELSAIRAEMTKNQSEVLAKFAELDQRLSAVESRFRIERP